MIKSLKDPFWGLLLVSIIVHYFALSQLAWKRDIPKKEEIFEVELIQPKIIPQKTKEIRKKRVSRPKTTQPKVKSSTKKTKSKTTATKKKKSVQRVTSKKTKKSYSRTKKTVKSSAAATTAKKSTNTTPKSTVTKPKPVPKPKPIKPAIKPKLSIKSSFPQKKDNSKIVPLRLSDKGLKSRKLDVAIKSTSELGLDEVPELEPDQNKSDQSIPKTFGKASVKGLDAKHVGTDQLKVEVNSQFLRKEEETEKYNVTQNEAENNEEESVSTDEAVENAFIEGEVSKRRIVYRPAPPELNIERDVTISLKFKVLPNGNVDQVLPYLKAEPELERLATKMLLQYKFEPLFGRNIVQSGIIHFTIYRKK